MGLSNKKTTTKEDSTSTSTAQNTGTQAGTSTTTPDVPSWLLNPAQQVAGGLGGLLAGGASAYTPQVSNLQQQSFNTAANLGNSDYFKQASDAINGVGNVSGESLLTNLDQYYNPFKDQVLNPVLNDYDFQSGQTRAAQAAAAAKNQAFGGSRYGIQEAQTEDALARGRATTEGGLLNQMFNTSTGLSSEDAGRRQQADIANQQAELQKASLLQGLGTAQGSEARANLGVQAGLGAAQTDQQNQIAQYPLEYQQQMESLLAGLNPSAYFGTTTNSTGNTSGTTNTTGTGTGTTTATINPGLLGALGQAAQIASLFPMPH